MNRRSLKMYSVNNRRNLIVYYLVLIHYYHTVAMNNIPNRKKVDIADRKVDKLKKRLVKVLQVHMNNDKYKDDHLEWLHEKLISMGQTPDTYLYKMACNMLYTKGDLYTNV